MAFFGYSKSSNPNSEHRIRFMRKLCPRRVLLDRCRTIWHKFTAVFLIWGNLIKTTKEYQPQNFNQPPFPNGASYSPTVFRVCLGPWGSLWRQRERDPRWSMQGRDFLLKKPLFWRNTKEKPCCGTRKHSSPSDRPPWWISAQLLLAMIALSTE